MIEWEWIWGLGMQDHKMPCTYSIVPYNCLPIQLWKMSKSYWSLWRRPSMMLTNTILLHQPLSRNHHISIVVFFFCVSHCYFQSFFVFLGPFVERRLFTIKLWVSYKMCLMFVCFFAHVNELRRSHTFNL
jgi:hypothetical protein